MSRRNIRITLVIALVSTALVVIMGSPRSFATSQSTASCISAQVHPLEPRSTAGVPVLLVHGINSSPSAFERPGGVSLADQLEGIPGVSVWTFNYHTQSL